VTLLGAALGVNEGCLPFCSKRRFLSLQQMEADHGLPALTWQHALAVRILILTVLCLKVSLKCLLCVCPINLEMTKWFSLWLWSAIRKKILWIETIYIHLNEQSCSFLKRLLSLRALKLKPNNLGTKDSRCEAVQKQRGLRGYRKEQTALKVTALIYYFGFFSFISQYLISSYKSKLLGTSLYTNVNFSLKRCVSGLCRSLENTVGTHLLTWKKK